ncbi:uncharacterized protein LOC110042005 [Orbicella faveolata]|uniref:uncharacterized protein LOC110042005 n=1 Tax=Orbicella faveolata TaxID=48498 RepID=UPI0009E5F41F|nr:uncharacterized protein LOC110042005 [Orbicella faveolata]
MTCQNLGGDLAIVRSEDENNFILELLKKQQTKTFWGAWLGLYRKPSAENIFYWIDDTPLAGQYSAWANGEPNSVNEKCVHMIATSYKQGKWNDRPCSLGDESRAPVVLCQKSFMSRQNKAYLLEIGSEKIPVFCRMNNLGACRGSGWTLVMKMNGSQRNFHFDSDLWSNKNSFNLDEGKLGFNTKETKLPTYWNTPFSKVCLGTRNNNKMKYTVIDKQASSLYSLIADGNYRPTSLGRDTWKSLIGSQGSLQSSCNQEGFNVVGSGEIYRPKARIGILGNNENHCRTCDSRIGFGTGGKQDDSNTCGNETSHGYEHTHIKAMGFILVL